MKKTILSFSLLIIALVTLFQISKYAVLFGNTSIEFVTTIVALIFLLAGIFLSKRTQKPKSSQIDFNKIESLDISKREYEVLQEISKGLSNKEIADKLFVTESTIKTHVSNLLFKLNAKRRTQAIQKAKELNILN